VADIGGLQLLPETRKKIDYRKPGQNRLLFLAFIFVGLILAIYGGLYFYKGTQKTKLDDIDNQLVANEKARSKTDEEKLLALKNSIAAIGPVLSGHVKWSEALTHIQGLVNPKVKFDTLSVNLSKKEYSFKGYAANYATIAKQIAAFYADSAITDLSVGKITSQPDGSAEFTMVLVLDLEKAFNKK